MANQLLLVNNVFTDYHASVSNKCWAEFAAAFNDSRKVIQKIITAEDGPIRRKRAEQALVQLKDALQSMPDENQLQNVA